MITMQTNFLLKNVFAHLFIMCVFIYTYIEIARK